MNCLIKPTRPPNLLSQILSLAPGRLYYFIPGTSEQQVFYEKDTARPCEAIRAAGPSLEAVSRGHPQSPMGSRLAC